MPCCLVKINMYNANVHVHMDMYLRGVSIYNVHVHVYTCIYLHCTAVGRLCVCSYLTAVRRLSGCLHLLPAVQAQAAEPHPCLSDHCKGEGEGEEAEGE